jgi:HEAT repeat protein
MRNLAREPAHREIVEKMSAALKQHTLEVNDNGFLPEGSTLEGYAEARARDAYPLERVFALATLASERLPKNLPKLMAGLEDPSEPIRWWAAQGCAMLGSRALPAEVELRKRLADESGAVQVAAAEALARMGKSEIALPTLERCLSHTNLWFALQAANVFDRLGEQARPALPELKMALRSATEAKGRGNASEYLERILQHTLSVLEGTTPALVYPKEAN